MLHGAFAVLDCLGFKGIWQRANPALVIQKLERISETVKDSIYSPQLARFLDTEHILDPDNVHYEVRFFSDTVVIGLRWKHQLGNASESNLEVLLISELARIVIKIQALFIQDEPHLAMRGCITFGEFLLDRDFFVGPAVDDAAEHFELANGAFVWLHRSAERILEKYFTEYKVIPDWEYSFTNPQLRIFFFPEIVAWPLPLRNYGSLNVWVVNTMLEFRSPDVQNEIIEIYQRSMDSARLDVLQKRENTLTYLREAATHSAAYANELLRMKNQSKAARGAQLLQKSKLTAELKNSEGS